jgi:hypothetical protein
MKLNPVPFQLPARPDELDRRLAMSYLDRYRLMMRLFRIGKMMEGARDKAKN